MTPDVPPTVTLKSVRPLVRYVDEDQAVLDIVFSLTRPERLREPVVDLHVRLTGPGGRATAVQSSVAVQAGAGRMRFGIDEPRRWWPAGMGDQALYALCVTLLADDQVLDSHLSTLGMTSVRAPRARARSQPGLLLVNGRQYEIQSVVPIERTDEHSVLPVASDSLLLVRDHFGPDLLYEAADRAGILLIQSVPLSHQAATQVAVRREVDRLAAHPSLAGWLVASPGRVGDRMAQRLAQLDPTRNVFREFPVAS